MRACNFLIAALAAVFLAASAAHAAGCSVDQPEAFSPFFDRYANDREFAGSRTIYPAQRVRYEYALENGKQQIIEWRRTVSRQQDADTLPFADYIRLHGLTYGVTPVAPSRQRVEVRQPGAAWFMTYDFARRDGCWFLGEIQLHAVPGA